MMRDADGVYWGSAPIGLMRGLTFTAITGCKPGSDEVIFETNSSRFVFWHEQDCCESVEVEQVDGDVADLIGEPLLMAEEAVEESITEDYESRTWTFYKFATAKGYVTVRWLGRSNGYYGERVSLRVEALPCSA